MLKGIAGLAISFLILNRGISIDFLRGDHLKGDDSTEVLVSSNFNISEEIEQMGLF